MRKLSVDELDRLSIEEFKKKEKLPLVIVLDNVRSMHNIGSIFRSADAYLAKAIYLCGITAKPPHKDIHKTALGATESVDWTYFNDTAAAIDELKKQGYIIIAIEQTENGILLQDNKVIKEEKYAIVFGHEVKGIDQKVVDVCGLSISLPQYGTKHSLNVSVCAGIVLWEFYKKLNE